MKFKKIDEKTMERTTTVEEVESYDIEQLIADREKLSNDRESFIINIDADIARIDGIISEFNKLK